MQNQIMYFSINFSTLAKKIKRFLSKIDPSSIIVVGGHDPTFHVQTPSKNELAKKYIGVDYIWQGEAERDLLLEFPHLKKQSSPTIIEKLDRGIKVLDGLPILTRANYPCDVGFLSTSRGCFQSGCDICTTPIFYPTDWKSRSLDHVKKEIYSLQNAGKKFVFICDDNFLGFNNEHLDRRHEIIMRCKNHGLKVIIITTKEQLLKVSRKQYLAK